MIGALLSNTPANLLRGNGVAGEMTPVSDDGTSDRAQLSARESQASPGATAIRAGQSPVLTQQAVLALQQADAATFQKQGSSGAGEADPNEASQDSAADADGSPVKQAQQEPQGAVANPIQSSSKGDKEEDPDGDGLNEAEEKQVEELAKRDREVRAHEQAHARVGGAYASAPSYTFQQGPDGKRYAIGGEVQIDTAKERTPEATIRKMQIVIRAATAPAEPSSQDLKVAQQARSQLSEAQAQLRQQKAEELRGGDDKASSVSDTSTGPESSAPDNADGAAPDGGVAENERAGQEENGVRRESEDAAAAYQSALQRVNEAEALFAALVA